MLNKNKQAQIWVETAVYTLIGLTIMAILLAIIMPQINQAKDRTVIQDTITSLEEINTKILETAETPGNVRIINLRISKGILKLDSTNNKLIYTLENTKLELSQPGEELKEGNLFLKTETQGSNFKITLTLPYNEIDLTTNTAEDELTFQRGSTPYKIKIENLGELGSKTNIDLTTI